jgi:hypothetical protein
MQQVHRYRQDSLQAAVNVYPEDADIVATVGSSFKADGTMATRPIGFDRTPVPLLDGVLIRRRLQHLAGKFMA